MKRWYELPDGTLVRDSRGELRMVRHAAHNGDVWLHHWSDEYGPVWDKRTGKVGDVGGEDIDELVTVMQAVPAADQ